MMKASDAKETADAVIKYSDTRNAVLEEIRKASGRGRYSVFTVIPQMGSAEIIVELGKLGYRIDIAPHLDGTKALIIDWLDAK